METDATTHTIKLEVSDSTEFEQTVQFLTEEVLGNFKLKTIDGDLYFFERGIYKIRKEATLTAWIEKRMTELGYQDKYSIKLSNEVLFHVKNRTYTPPEEVEKYRYTIAFENGYLDIKKFLETGQLTLEDYEIINTNSAMKELPNGSIDFFQRAIITPIDSAAEKIVLHKLPVFVAPEPLAAAMDIYSMGKLFCPKIFKFFSETAGAENVVLQFEKIGYAMLPENPLNMAFMEVGDGSNGKSTFLRLLSVIIGPANISNITLQQMCDEPFMASYMYHKLANISADLPKFSIKYTGTFKMATGEDVINADRKHRDPIQFQSYAKPLFAANELPKVSDNTGAWWRRWIVTEYPNKFSPNPDLFNELLEEKNHAAIVALYALRQLMIKRRFSVREDANFEEVWKKRASSTYRFIKEASDEGIYTLGATLKVEKDVLYDDYTEWVDDPVSKTVFTKELEQTFRIKPTRIRTPAGQKQFYVGIGKSEAHLSETTDTHAESLMNPAFEPESQEES